MIILSGVLVVLAIALLVTGIVTGNTGHEIAGLDGLKLIYVSIGISIVSALFLAVGVFVRRKELFGTAASQAPAKSTKSTVSGRATRPTKAKARVGAGEETPVPLASSTVTEVPAETTVWVVPGRKRYHLETCRQLAGRDKEELTYVEAREEGFTACTACLPDTALAARAAMTDADTAERSADSATVPAASGMDGSSTTRTDIPVTARMPVIEESSPAEIVEQPETSGLSEPATEYAETAETSEAPEPAEASEYDTERPSQPSPQSRSLFEPLDHTAADEETADGDETPVSELYAPEGTTQEETAHEAAHEPEDAASRWSDEELAAWDEDPEPAEAREEPAAEAESDTAQPADETGADAHTADADEQPSAEASHDDADTDLADDTTADDDHDAGAADHDADDHGTDSGDDAEASDADGGSDTLTIVRILSGTKRYHRPDCALIEDIADDDDDLETLPPSEAKDRGCTPCLVCQPDKESPDIY